MACRLDPGIEHHVEQSQRKKKDLSLIHLFMESRKPLITIPESQMK